MLSVEQELEFESAARSFSEQAKRLAGSAQRPRRSHRVRSGRRVAPGNSSGNATRNSKGEVKDGDHERQIAPASSSVFQFDTPSESASSSNLESNGLQDLSFSLSTPEVAAADASVMFTSTSAPTSQVGSSEFVFDFGGASQTSPGKQAEGSSSSVEFSFGS